MSLSVLSITIRIRLRRFIRLTSDLSKKLENHLPMQSLYSVHDNFCCQHKS